MVRRKRRHGPKGRESQDRLLHAAETLFADRGYEAVSVRDITGRAGSNLSSVRYYFGSKAGLFDAVLRRRLEPINEARLTRLRATLRESGRKGSSVEAVLSALIEPLVDVIRQDPSAESWLRLAGRSRIERGRQWESTSDLHRTTFRAFVNAFARALPDLPRRVIAQRVFWLTGGVANSLIDTRDLTRLGYRLHGVTDRPDLAVPMLISFYVGAMQAPVTVTTR